MEIEKEWQEEVQGMQEEKINCPIQERITEE